MRAMSIHEARTWLRANGVSSATVIEDIVKAFDFSRPVYLQQFQPEQVLYQFIRRPSTQDSAMAGNWFCLKGATKSNLAIMDGVSGRILHAYRVARSRHGSGGIPHESDLKSGLAA